MTKKVCLRGKSLLQFAVTQRAVNRRTFVSVFLLHRIKKISVSVKSPLFRKTTPTPVLELKEGEKCTLSFNNVNINKIIHFI